MDTCSDSHAAVIETLRLRIARIARVGETSARAATHPVHFGLEAIDRRLPGHGLATGVLHEVLGQGADTEHATVASLLIGGLLARFEPTRPVLWAMQRDDLFAPGLAGVGLHPHRLILAECGQSVLAVMEEALHHPGLAAVVGEVEGRLGLTASRRLQLAAEASGVTAFAIRRSRRFDDPMLLAPSAAMSRWRIGALPQPSRPQPADALPDRALWRLELLRCREASPFNWIVQACDARGRLADIIPAASQFRHDSGAPDRVPLAALLADGSAASQAGRRYA